MSTCFNEITEKPTPSHDACVLFDRRETTAKESNIDATSLSSRATAPAGGNPREEEKTPPSMPGFLPNALIQNPSLRYRPASLRSLHGALTTYQIAMKQGLRVDGTGIII